MNPLTARGRFSDNPNSTARRKARWTRDVIERRHSMPGIEPGALGPAPETLRPPMLVEDKRSTAAHRNWGDQPDSHRHSRLHGAGCCCYIMITNKLARRGGARRAKAGAPGRTRTDEYGFTKPALWLLRHRGVEMGNAESGTGGGAIRDHSALRILNSAFKVALSRGLAPRTSAFAKRRAESTYTLRANWHP